MKLSRTVAYAVQATLQLAQGASKSPVPCSVLAARGGMPERFLLQILRSLVNHGILLSTRGVDGGYTLERSAESITLLDLIEAVEGPLSPVLPNGGGLPHESTRLINDALCEITALARRELAAVSLAQLVSAGRRPARELVGFAVQDVAS
jgi:Rrf2 family protein